MILATGSFVSMDAIAKFLLQSYPIPEVVWARYAAHLALMLLVFRARVVIYMTTRRIGLQLLRSTFLIASTLMFFAAISTIPLATGSAIMFTAPILVTALSGPLLGERVGPRRWAGVVIGCIGALVIVRPGGADWTPVMLFAVGAAALYALYQVATRALSTTDRSQTTLFYTSLMGAVIMSAVVPFFWVTPTINHALLMAATGVFGGISHYALVKAFALAPASVITPLGYTNLIWATFFGFVFFAELPDAVTFLGAGIIALSGIYIFQRERMARKSDRA